MKRKAYRDFFREIEESESARIAEVIYDFVEGLHGAVVDQGMTYAQLAERIGKSPAYVTRVMRGDYNLTIATMVRYQRQPISNRTTRRPSRLRPSRPSRRQVKKAATAEGTNPPAT